mmetsp:Transcript_49717/g.144239  ORF Transcript_49717/g.144239 Transcript_49717/m.144239 type:complete len:228 (+) Transcript_49717:579-1262(+)
MHLLAPLHLAGGREGGVRRAAPPVEAPQLPAAEQQVPGGPGEVVGVERRARAGAPHDEAEGRHGQLAREVLLEVVLAQRGGQALQDLLPQVLLQEVLIHVQRAGGVRPLRHLVEDPPKRRLDNVALAGRELRAALRVLDAVLAVPRADAVAPVHGIPSLARGLQGMSQDDGRGAVSGCPLLLCQGPGVDPLNMSNGLWLGPSLIWRHASLKTSSRTCHRQVLPPLGK